MKILALDIGGANLKYAIARIDKNERRILDHGIINIYANTLDYFEMKLEENINKLSQNVNRIYFTTTATLLYQSLSYGAKKIVKIVNDSTCLDSSNIYYFSRDGKFNTIDIFRSIDIEGCYNWCITRDFIKKKIKNDCLLIDCGSSSTDIVPINVQKQNRNYNIYERVLKGELLYIGMRRTLVQTIANNVLVGENKLTVCGENTTRIGDINYILGHIDKKEYSLDNNIITERALKKRAYFNVARLLCGDLNIISKDILDNICKYISEEMKNKIADGIKKVIKDNFNKHPDIIVCGIGSNFIKNEVLNNIKYNKLLTLENFYNLNDIEYTPALGIIEILGD